MIAQHQSPLTSSSRPPEASAAESKPNLRLKFLLHLDLCSAVRSYPSQVHSQKMRLHSFAQSIFSTFSVQPKQLQKNLHFLHLPQSWFFLRKLLSQKARDRCRLRTAASASAEMGTSPWVTSDPEDITVVLFLKFPN